MCFNLLFFISWIRHLQIFHHHIQEWPKHKQLLLQVADFLSALDSDRQHLLKKNVFVEDWHLVDRTIREAKLQLNQVIRLVDWSKRTRSFQFALKYKTATIYGDELRASMERLQELRNRMDSLKTKLELQRMYFREERGRTDGALARHFMRHLGLKEAEEEGLFVICWAGAGSMHDSDRSTMYMDTSSSIWESDMEERWNQEWGVSEIV